MPVSKSGRWVSTGDAGKMLGVDSRIIRRMADAGELSQRRFTETSPRYVDSDEVEELARKSVKPRSSGK
jgi:hypothetical protein